jgi:hypothetical protein
VQGQLFARWADLCALSISQPFRQLDKLISDTNVVGQASEPYAFACAAHTLFLVRTELPAV